METSTSAGGLMSPKWMLKPWANISVLPLVRLGRDVGGVEVALDVIGYEHHHDVGCFGGLGGREDGESGSGGLGAALAFGREAYDNVEAGIAQVQCVRVSWSRSR